MSETEQISELVRPLVDAMGYELYDVQRNGGTLAVLVDGPEGVDIDELGRLSRSVSSLLDEHDPIPGRYTLEVSSPGVERRLRRQEHFVGAVGEVINVRTLPGEQGRRRVVGELSGVEGDVLIIDDRELGPTRLAISEIEKARTVFEWGPAPKPGQPGANKKSAGASGNKRGGPGR